MAVQPSLLNPTWEVRPGGSSSTKVVSGVCLIVPPVLVREPRVALAARCYRCTIANQRGCLQEQVSRRYARLLFFLVSLHLWNATIPDKAWPRRWKRTGTPHIPGAWRAVGCCSLTEDRRPCKTCAEVLGNCALMPLLLDQCM